MTTPLILSDFGITNELPSSPDDMDEYIDPPPLYTVDLRAMGDSLNSPLDGLEKTARSPTISLSDRFSAFRAIYQSPYVNKNQRCIAILLDFLADESIDKDIRFSWLTQLKVSSDSLDVCLYGYVYWFYTYDDPMLHKLMSAQFLLTHPVAEYPFIKTHMKFCQQYLYTISRKTSESIMLRSEAADILIRLGTPNFRDAAQKVIHDLGHQYVPKRERTVFNHHQNIHEIESIKEILEMFKLQPLTITPDNVFAWCINDEIAQRSFQRILVDTGMYEGLRMSELICHVFQRIQVSPFRTELEQRLVEELHEMDGWCSTGHMVRLVNVFQGFDPLIQVKIPIKEEIRSSIYARLTTMMKTVSKELQDELMEAFCQSDKTLLEEFIDTYSPYEELKREYVDSKLIRGVEFDLYYQQCIKEYMG